MPTINQDEDRDKLIREFLEFSKKDAIERQKENIYLVRSDGYIKIGYTFDILNRLGGLQLGNPKRLELVYTHKVLEVKILEERLHQKFSEKRVLGEWFLLNERDVNEAINYIQTYAKIHDTE